VQTTSGNLGLPRGITVKSPKELELMEQAGRVVASVIDLLKKSLEPGMKTRDLDSLAAKEIKRLGAKAAFLGYRGFPATICTSINEEIVHGIPGKRMIKNGDLVKMDVGAIIDGLYADAAVTVGAGEITLQAQDLINATRESLNQGISQIRPGARLGDIGASIQEYAESKGYGVVREYVGHGIGRALHEEPQVPNYGSRGKGFVLRDRMVLALEPMLNIGTWRTRLMDDDWTVVTEDSSLSAHFEHSVIVTELGYKIITVL